MLWIVTLFNIARAGLVVLVEDEAEYDASVSIDAVFDVEFHITITPLESFIDVAATLAA